MWTVPQDPPRFKGREGELFMLGSSAQVDIFLNHLLSSFPRVRAVCEN